VALWYPAPGPSNPAVLGVAAYAPDLTGRRIRMKLANHGGRAALLLDDGIVDVATAFDGRFGPDLGAIYDEWDAFAEIAGSVTSATGPLVEADLGSPVPAPRQVFAIGLNYRSHAEESGMALPAFPATFTKPASVGRSPTSRSSVTASTGRSSSWW
jgi:2-keto-4-pentenoate hydratase/2-oxohepta-3-ene-1,7-dioic acid hydratase in catechol pathway